MLACALALQAPAALAQTQPAPPNEAPVLQLTPRTPSGGVYGAGPSVAPAPSGQPAPSATPSVAPAPAPVGAFPAPSELPPPPPALPPPPPGALGTEVQPIDPSLSGLTGEDMGASAEQLREARVAVMRARLRLLNTVLPGLAARSRSRRIFDGVLNVGIGASLAGVSFLVPAGSGTQDLRPWFWTIAGTQIVSGVVELAWAPARERLGAQFEAMPMGTARERRLRVQFGEQALEEMANDGRRRRILMGVTDGLLTVGSLAIVYREPLFNGTPYTFGPFDAVILGLTGLSLVRSLLSVIQPSEDERMRDSYRSQLHVLRAERGLADR